jgi:DNA repair exonuclease SbcCD nuclease subunit
LIKILHSADIHLDSPLASLALRDAELREKVAGATRRALRRLVDVALDEQVAALLIAGDLFDGAARSAKTAAFLLAELDRLQEARIPVFVIKGNHDAENPLTGEVTLPANVHVFDGRGGKMQVPGQDIWVHGVSFSGRHAPDSLLGKFQPPVPGAVNIAMLHTSLSGAAGHDPYAPCSVSDLAAMGFDYWALGHVHKRQIHSQAPWIVMPGIPQGRDIGEDGPKSASLITIASDGITVAEVPTASVLFHRAALDVSGMDTPDVLRGALRQVMRTERADLRAETLVLRLTLTGATPLAWEVERDRAVWTETAARLGRETGGVYLDKLVLDLTPPRTADTADTLATASAELAEIMGQIAAEPGFAAWRDAELDTLLSDLPPRRRAALLPDAAALTHLAADLGADGARQMIARLKGASD